MSLDNLPVEWLLTSIENISEVIAGGTPKANDPENFVEPPNGIGWLTPADLSGYSHKYIGHGKRDLSEKGYKSSSAKLIPKGSVVFSSRAPIGYVAIASNEISTNQGFKNFVIDENISSEYLYYYLKRIRDLAESLGTGTTFKELSGSACKKLPFVLASLVEQQEIVRQLDVMLTQVEQIKARLDAIPALLKKFRQSVLADAVSGNLTEEWRAQNTLKPIDISNIYQEHEKYFKDKGVKKYQKPNEISIDNHPYDLPNSWSWFRAEQLCDLITKGTTPSKDKMSTNGEVPYIKVYNLTFDGTLDFTIEPTFISKQTHDGELARSKVFIGDVLMNIVGPPLGKVSIVPSQYKEWNINQAISIFRPVTGVKNKYLAICLMDTKLLEITIRKAKATAGQSNLTLEICRDFPIPIPPIEEQIEIIELVNKLLGNASNIEKLVESAQKRVNLLMQSILAKAFSGELTAEWREQHQELITGINSAESLLAKIQAEREASKPVKKTRVKKKV